MFKRLLSYLGFGAAAPATVEMSGATADASQAPSPETALLTDHPIERVEFQKLADGRFCYRVSYVKGMEGAPTQALMCTPVGVPMMRFPTGTPMVEADVMDLSSGDYERRLALQKEIHITDDERQRSEALRLKLVERINRHGDINQIDVPRPLFTLEEYFEGNHRIGSIGCNLTPMPPPSEFYETFKAIRSRADVADVLVEIRDHDDPESWPFTDTVWVITSASVVEARTWMEDEYMRPDDIVEGFHDGVEQYEVPRGMRALGFWWD